MRLRRSTFSDAGINLTRAGVIATNAGSVLLVLSLGCAHPGRIFTGAGVEFLDAGSVAIDAGANSCDAGSGSRAATLTFQRVDPTQLPGNDVRDAPEIDSYNQARRKRAYPGKTY